MDHFAAVLLGIELSVLRTAGSRQKIRYLLVPAQAFRGEDSHDLNRSMCHCHDSQLYEASSWDLGFQEFLKMWFLVCPGTPSSCSRLLVVCTHLDSSSCAHSCT